MLSCIYEYYVYQYEVTWESKPFASSVRRPLNILPFSTDFFLFLNDRYKIALCTQALIPTVI